MSIKNSLILFVIMGSVLASCGQVQTPEPTATPLPTTRSSPTAIPTLTSTPTHTATPIPVSLAYNPVPRWMILDQPFSNVEILGEQWKYTNDRWGETYACISYTREREPYVFFEECFALTQPDLTFESQRDAFLNNDYKIITPNNTFGAVGQISLMAKRLDDNSTKFVKFFELMGIDEYILLVEMNVVTDDMSQLQHIYEDQAAETIEYALKNMLEKSRLIPRPTATPLSPMQESFYPALSKNLITESEASNLYGGTWEILEDYVDSKDPMVCRHFEDRTNADVLWVYFSNCVYLYGPQFSFDGFVESKKKPDNVFLDSHHQYDEHFLLYGQFDGHTYFHAWMIHGKYLYYVMLESRTLGGQGVEDVFTTYVDDFIYGVLNMNIQRELAE